MNDYQTLQAGVNYAPYLLFGLVALLSWLVQMNFQSKFKKYSKMMMPGGLTGREIAEKMLHENGIYDVKVISTPGQLTDHYNPINKTVNLSDVVYASNSVAAAAVAAHECGHAVQHAKSYAPLQMRSRLVPIINISSRWLQWILLGGILVLNVFPQLLLLGIILFSLTTLFSIVTLPVEVDASRRALAWLNGAGITNNQTGAAAKGALKAAAYTYFIAALSSLATLFYYIMIFMGRRN